MVKLPAWMMKAWAFTGLNSTLLMLMTRGALPPVIALAAYQATPWANLFTTIGYLVAIMTLLSMPIQTRAKFIQAMIMSVFFTCMGAATSLLQILCVVSARHATTHTYTSTTTGTSGGSESTAYNASASTVAGIFLVLYIYLANLIRAYRPALMIPCIQWSILTICSSIYGPLFPDMRAGELFIRRMLLAFLTGMGLATGVSLFVFPMTSRTIARRQIGGVLGLMKAIFATHKLFMQAVLEKDEDGYRDDKKVAAQSKKMQGLIISVSELFSKMKLEISFARKEFAFGKYQPKDFKEIEDLLRGIMLPMIGLSTFLGMTRTSEEIRAEVSENPDTEELMAVMRKLRPNDWNEIFELSAEPYAQIQAALTDGINHISYVLEVSPKPKAKTSDVEAKGTLPPQPGDVNFSLYLKAQIDNYHEHRQTVIQRWSEQKGIALPATFWQDSEGSSKARRRATVEIKSKNLQQQLYLQLFAEFVIYSMAKAVLKMVVFADEKLASGAMTRKRFVNPGWRRIRKLLYSSFNSDNTPYLHNQGRASVQMWVGDALKEKRDPEHLPPVTFYERFTDKLRMIPKILSSPESAFASRAALAAISIAVVAYLRQSQEFFIHQRGMWALIMASISMGANTGIGLWGFALRILGTAVAMVASIAIWYIGYKQPGAILPVLFIYLLLCWWFTLKQLRFMMVGLISMVTAVLIIGYELQSQKIGISGSEKNGQHFYPIYILAPMRLLVVIIGIFVAFVWTYMPYPVTTHATLRKDLGESLQLMANFYSAVHTLVDIRMHQGIPESDDKESPAAKVEKARIKVLHKCVVMLGQLREHAEHSKFEPTFGGQFPREKYDKLIDSIQKIFHYLYLISYAANSFVTTTDDDESEWVQDFRRFTAEISITSHRFTSILCQVSASIINCQALPPYLSVPKPEPLSERMSEVDPDILSIEHIHEPSYAAFAALTVTSSLLSEEMSRIVRLVKDLVGEVDFSYAVVKPPESKRATRTSRALRRVSRWVGPP